MGLIRQEASLTGICLSGKTGVHPINLLERNESLPKHCYMRSYPVRYYIYTGYGGPECFLFLENQGLYWRRVAILFQTA